MQKKSVSLDVNLLNADVWLGVWSDNSPALKNTHCSNMLDDCNSLLQVLAAFCLVELNNMVKTKIIITKLMSLLFKVCYQYTC